MCEQCEDANCTCVCDWVPSFREFRPNRLDSIESPPCAACGHGNRWLKWNQTTPVSIKMEDFKAVINKRKEFSKEQKEYISKLQHYKCKMCKERLGAFPHGDHKLQKLKGGVSTTTNLQMLCADCDLTSSHH